MLIMRIADIVYYRQRSIKPFLEFDDNLRLSCIPYYPMVIQI